MNFGTLYHGPKVDESWEDKKAQRKKIDEDIRKYLRAGGVIEELPCTMDEERPQHARPVYIHREGNA